MKYQLLGRFRDLKWHCIYKAQPWVPKFQRLFQRILSVTSTVFKLLALFWSVQDGGSANLNTGGLTCRNWCLHWMHLCFLLVCYGRFLKFLCFIISQSKAIKILQFGWNFRNGGSSGGLGKLPPRRWAVIVQLTQDTSMSQTRHYAILRVNATRGSAGKQLGENTSKKYH